MSYYLKEMKKISKHVHEAHLKVSKDIHEEHLRVRSVYEKHST